MKVQLIKNYHKLRFNYLYQLYNDCLDSGLKQKILKMANYHLEKFNKC
jgi:hypothetical protein